MQYVAVPGCLQFVQEVVQGWDAFPQAFELPSLSYHLAGVAAVAKEVPRQDLLMVKQALGEGLATSVGSKVGSEAKGPIDRQVCLDHQHGGTGHQGLLI